MDQYYAQLEAMLKSGKDSIFEPCEIRNFDTKTMTAEVFFVRSKQTRRNTVVLFPAFFQDYGIFAVPVDGTKAMAFWGADNQVFVFPAQYNLPSVIVEDGETKLDSTTKTSDISTSLDFLSQGETLIRSVAGSYIYMDALRDVEIGTENFHFLKLTNEDGKLHAGIEGFDFTGDYFKQACETVDIDGISGQRYRLTLKKGDVLPDPGVIENPGYLVEQLIAEDNKAAIDGVNFGDADEILTIEAGMLYDYDEIDDENVARKIKGDENTVYSLAAGNGKIELGENGTMKITADDVILDIQNAEIEYNSKKYTLGGLIERIELISTLLEIPDPLDEVGE